ncbi:hypothetical protein WJX72_011326 [[Myrmecia] bisecta]|uniref:Carboxypeptidase n=1 Tax=[Myrmecia] bisecta TaxID=41462 RepID=A0AAW1QTI5_9CHLO
MQPKSLDHAGNGRKSTKAGDAARVAHATADYTEDAEKDRVTELPGWGKPEFELFSGYVTVDEEAGRALFYALAESTHSPKTDPLVLWLNGGPGCSSLAGGFMSELGPFYPTPGGKLQANRYSWTQAANIIFLESPAFVGWSYSNTTSDATVGDVRTAQDARIFLLKFLERFPQYANRPFWIAGESYGGHYVPNLALEILAGNESKDNPKINLQGFLVGNAWTDPQFDNEGAIDFWWSHAMVSDETRTGVRDHCNFSNIGPLAQDELQPLALQRRHIDDEECTKLINSMRFEMGDINIYDIYVDVCHYDRAFAEAKQLALQARGRPSALAASIPAPGQYDPCVDDEVAVYFNRPDVQRAMHANVTNLPYPWQSCAGEHVNYSLDDLFSSMLPKWHKLLQSGLKMLVYSGDVDGIVPVIGSRRWISSLGLPIRDPWRPWMSATGQVGGYVVRYDGLTFVTVRNAGHMVPYTQPERAFYLFSHWLQGKPL